MDEALKPPIDVKRFREKTVFPMLPQRADRLVRELLDGGVCPVCGDALGSAYPCQVSCGFSYCSTVLEAADGNEISIRRLVRAVGLSGPFFMGREPAPGAPDAA